MFSIRNIKLFIIIIPFNYNEIKMFVREVEEEFKKDFYGVLDTEL